MGIAKRIEVVIDVVTDKARGALGRFRDDVGAAEGAAGKMRAGVTSAMASAGVSVGTLAVGAGAALVAFGAKAVAAFETTAKASIDMATATGLSVEEASRWIGIGDDFQVGAVALESGIGKVAKTLSDTKWAEFGIATHDAGGEARSVNDILLKAAQ